MSVFAWLSLPDAPTAQEQSWADWYAAQWPAYRARCLVLAEQAQRCPRADWDHLADLLLATGERFAARDAAGLEAALAALARAVGVEDA